MYAHALIYKLNYLTHSYNINDFILLPRYFLLSLIYWTLSNANFPIAVFISIATGILFYAIIESRKFKNLRYPFKAAVIFFVSILIYFYSASSFALLIYIACLLTRSYILFFVVSIISPFGTALALITIFMVACRSFFRTSKDLLFSPILKFRIFQFNRKYIGSLTSLLMMLLSLYFISKVAGYVKITGNSYNNYFVSLNPGSAIDLFLERSVESYVILYILIIATIIYFLEKLIAVKINFVRLPLLSIAFSLIICLHYLNIDLNRCSPINLILRRQTLPLPIVMAWLPSYGYELENKNVYTLMSSRNYCK